MLFQVRERLVSVLTREPRQGEISDAARDSHNGQKRSPAHPKSTGTEHRNLHRQRQGRYGGDENGDQAEPLKPGMQALAESVRDVFFEEYLAAFARDREQDTAADE